MNIKMVIQPQRKLTQETLVQNILIVCIPLREAKDKKKFSKNAKLLLVLILLRNNDISISMLYSLYCGIHQITINHYLNDVRSTDIQKKNLINDSNVPLK